MSDGREENAVEEKASATFSAQPLSAKKAERVAEVTDGVATFIRTGNSVTVAARAVGVSPATFYRWQDAGRVIADLVWQLEDLGRDELAALNRERKLGVRVTKRSRLDTLREKIAAALEAHPFHLFYRAVDQARAEHETVLVKFLHDAAKGGSWRAAVAVLERKYPERWTVPKGTGKVDDAASGREAEGPNPAARIRDELAAKRAAARERTDRAARA